jgi:hypothetical protein
MAGDRYPICKPVERPLDSVNGRNAPPSVEIAMAKFFVGPVAVVIAMLPAVALAQTTSPDPQRTQSVQPTSPNSGAGTPGQAGNKSGPSAKKPETTGSDTNSKPPQDVSKIPGKPGSKSGPAVRSPSSGK